MSASELMGERRVGFPVPSQARLVPHLFAGASHAR